MLSPKMCVIAKMRVIPTKRLDGTPVQSRVEGPARYLRKPPLSFSRHLLNWFFHSSHVMLVLVFHSVFTP
jgi:hypothetical protein